MWIIAETKQLDLKTAIPSLNDVFDRSRVCFKGHLAIETKVGPQTLQNRGDGLLAQFQTKSASFVDRVTPYAPADSDPMIM
jgi:hypothetical protein